MSGFDDPGIFYSDSFGGDTAADEGQARKSQLQRRFKEFLRQYRVGTDRTGFTFKYRCGLGRAEGGRADPPVWSARTQCEHASTPRAFCCPRAGMRPRARRGDGACHRWEDPGPSRTRVTFGFCPVYT